MTLAQIGWLGACGFGAFGCLLVLLGYLWRSIEQDSLDARYKRLIDYSIHEMTLILNPKALTMTPQTYQSIIDPNMHEKLEALGKLAEGKTAMGEPVEKYRKRVKKKR